MSPSEIENPTAQQVLDLTAEHLAGMKRQSTRASSITCAYRSVSGCRCAVGAWLRDDELHIPLDKVLKLSDSGAGFTTEARTGMTLDDLVSASVGTLAARGLLPARLMPHLGLLRKLQSAHDGIDHWSWDLGPNHRMVDRFIKIAIEFNLDPTSAVATLRRSLPVAA